MNKPVARLKSAAPPVIAPPAITLAPNTDTSNMQRALSEQGSTHATGSDISLERFQPINKDFDLSLLQVGQTYDIPLSLVSATENNARVLYKQEEVEQTGMLLTKDGQKVPAIGYVADGQVRLMDGQKRFNACLLYKLPKLKVLIEAKPASDIEEYETSRQINLERSTQTPFDDAIRWAHFLASGQYTSHDDICERLKLSRTHVSKTIGLNRIPTSLKRLMLDHESTCTLSVAYEVSTIFSNADSEKQAEREQMAEEVIQHIQKKSLSYLKAVELIKSKLSGPKSRIRSVPAQIKFGDHKGTIVTIPEKGVFTMSFTGLPEAELQKLQELTTNFLNKHKK